ncbi:MAG: patatin-like phospholipase family protein [Nanobdellota archaeon]
MALAGISIKELKENKFSLVLSGGVALGFAHVGVIKFLEENNLIPDEVLGTSMGALVGALYAIGKNSSEIDELLKNAEKSKLFKTKIGKGKIEYTVLNKFLKEIFGDLKLKDAKLDLKITATEVNSGNGKVFSKEDDVLILDVVRASISLPGVFSFKKINDIYYMDGGVFSNLPVEHAKKKNIILASNVVNNNVKLDYKCENKLFSRLKSNWIVYNHLLTYLMKNQTYSKIQYIDNLFLIEPDLSKQNRYSLKDYSKSIDIGYNTIKKAILP